jgi:hypothetical protein
MKLLFLFPGANIKDRDVGCVFKIGWVAVCIWIKWAGLARCVWLKGIGVHRIGDLGAA